MEILGIIPARGGSKGVLRKNVRPLAGKPLIAYTIDAARKSSELSRLVCTTDDLEVKAVAEALSCAVIDRPDELAGDTTPMKLVIRHTLGTLEREGYRPEFAVLLQPTSPFRTSTDIDRAAQMLVESGADSVVSVTEVPGHYHPDWQFTIGEDDSLSLWNGTPLSQIITRRQDLAPSYTRNGAVYAFRVASFLDTDSIYGNRCLGYVMDAADSINIDAEADFELAERRIVQQQSASAAEVRH